MKNIVKFESYGGENEYDNLDEGIRFIEEFMDTKKSDELWDVVKSELGFSKGEIFKILRKNNQENNINDLFSYWLISYIKKTDWKNEKSFYESFKNK